MSRSELVEATGLTRSSIGGLVSELTQLHLVIERQPRPNGSPGRPSPVVSCDRTRFGVLAMEIGVDSMTAAVVAIDGTLLRSARSLRSRDIGSPDETIRNLVGHVAEVVSSTTSVDLIGAGIAVAGAVRADDNCVVVAPNLGWQNVALGEAVCDAIEERLGLRLHVEVSNEADLGAMAESRLGAGRNADCMVYITGEVGLGGSVIVDGRRLAGHSGYAGEYGHVPINPAGSPCACGSTGCWETEVGERTLLGRAGLDPDLGAAGVDVLLDAAADGQERALEAIADSGRWLGLGIAGLVNVFDPELIVLGGLYGRLLPLARPALEAELRERRFRGLARDVAVVEAELGLSAGLIGAADLVVDRLPAGPAGVVGAARDRTLRPT
jgi:predicted NBD/HSP70 family sugar kinase